MTYEIDSFVGSINETFLAAFDAFSGKQRESCINFHQNITIPDIQHTRVRFGRAFKKFERPAGPEGSAARNSRSVEEWLLYDESLGKTLRRVPFYGEIIEVSPESSLYWDAVARENGDVLAVKRLLRKWLKGCSWRAADVGFGPGETFHSTKGDTSMIGKLLNTESWTVTKTCLNHLIRAVDENRTLKRVVIERAQRVLMNKPELARFLKLSNGRALTTRNAVLLTFEVVKGGRISTVYKDKEKSRVINVECLGNALVQYAILASLGKVLTALGNDLETRQDVHRKMCGDVYYDTTDLSNGSNSNIVGFMKWALKGLPILDDLMSTRSEYVLVPTEKGQMWYRTVGMSCQGNAWTFPLMTLVLLASCIVAEGRSSDYIKQHNWKWVEKEGKDGPFCGLERIKARYNGHESSVFGDDIVTPNYATESMIKIITDIGYKVNVKKSFIKGEVGLSETCGSFHHESYILCFDFKWAENPRQAISNINKVWLYSKFTNDSEKLFWEDLLDKLHTLTPDSVKGEHPSFTYRSDAPVQEWLPDSFDTYVWSEELTDTKSTGPAQWLERRFQWVTGTCRTLMIPMYRPKYIEVDMDQRADRLVYTSVRIRARAPVKRELRHQGDWVLTRAFLHEGFLILEPLYRYLRNTERQFLQKFFASEKLSSEMWEAYTMDHTVAAYRLRESFSVTSNMGHKVRVE